MSKLENRLAIAMMVFIVVCVALSIALGFQRKAFLELKFDCEKREALIKQADDYADSVEKTLDAERQRRADLEYEHEELLKKYNAVRRGGKRAKDYEKLPDAARADSLRDGILRAVKQ